MSDLLVDELSDRYRIDREIGRGGSAVVYLAHDVRHDRPVALKVLLPELAASVLKERFLREIQIAAKLSHPHILPLYDSGLVGESLYYAMPHVDGMSLRGLLQRERQLPLEDALRIAREVASALDYAHGHGVLHRDIKPENILLYDGVAMVTDFGIARALAADRGGVTHAGIAVGTPEYMSPEQASGSTELDGRSDVYSLGCVVYEMLAGHPPFSGSMPHEILSRHALDAPPRLAAARPEVPAAVELALRKALAKSPADRFRTAAEFAAALREPDSEPGSFVKRRRWYATAALAGIAALFAALLFGRNRPADAALREPSIAVLPFVNLSPDSATTDYFSDGLADELISALSRITEFQVVSRTSSFSLKGKSLDARQIGKLLDVAVVVEATVRRENDRIRVTVQLVNTANGLSLWSQVYDRNSTAVLELQGEIADSISVAITRNLAGNRALPIPSARVASTNPEAFELYLKGRYFWDRRGADNFRAMQFFTAAIAADSMYAQAYSGLADTYVTVGLNGLASHHEMFAKGRSAAVKAVSLDPSLAEAHASLGRVLQNADWDWAGAEREYQRAIQLKPSYALAHSWYGLMLTRLGRFDEAIREGEIAYGLDPLSATVSYVLAVTYSTTGDFDKARALLTKATEMAPDWGGPWRALARDNARRGNHTEALAQIDQAARPVSGVVPGIMLADRVAILNKAGRRAEALKLKNELLNERAAGNVRLTDKAVACAGVQERECTLRAMEQAFMNKEVPYYYYMDDDFDFVRTDPRFRAVLNGMGLPAVQPRPRASRQ
jgi:serine/threonine protein kinase/tetratricopeptide (TPR) repeat protein